MWTMPVPASSVTKSAARTRQTTSPMLVARPPRTRSNGGSYARPTRSLPFISRSTARSPSFLARRLDETLGDDEAPAVVRLRRRRSRASGGPPRTCSTARSTASSSTRGATRSSTPRTCPRRSSDEGERDVDARVVDRPVPLPHLAGAERRAALRPPPDDLVPLVEEALLRELAERPPDALDVRAVVGDVRVARGRPRRRRARSAPPTPSCSERPTRCTS